MTETMTATLADGFKLLLEALPRSPYVRCEVVPHNDAMSPFLRAWRRAQYGSNNALRCRFNARVTVNGTPMCRRHAGASVLDMALGPENWRPPVSTEDPLLPATWTCGCGTRYATEHKPEFCVVCARSSYHDEGRVDGRVIAAPVTQTDGWPCTPLEENET